jgi:glycosyltransferase involved in cell wall biosynthesis
MAKKLVYVANNRLPTEKAHGLQIVQMCEALADAGYDLTLVTPRRFNTPEMKALDVSLWEYYGVKQNFAFRRLPCLDLFPIFPRHHVAMLVQTFTYLVALLVWLLFRPVDVLYTRDLFLGFALAALRPRTKLIYEVHQRHKSRLGTRAQRFIVRRAFVVPITEHLAAEMRALGAQRVLVAHDGIRAARFVDVPAQADARAEVGWPPDVFIVGWVGRLHLMGVDKGVGLLVEALRQVEGAALAVVGGPDEMVETLRRRWIAAGLDAGRFLASGQVPPERVPLVLSAFDVCAMPHPWTEHFAYYTSPIKLFEYMASRRAIVASDLPGFAEVVTDQESALLVPPEDAGALAGAIRRLRDDAALRRRLADRAYAVVMARYTWQARAEAIRQFVEG